MKDIIQLISDLILDIIRQPAVVDPNATAYAVVRMEECRRSIRYSERVSK